MSSPIMAPELSLALQYLGVQFCCIDSPSCWLDDWYQYVLAKVDTSTVELGYELLLLKAIIAEAKEFFTGVVNDNLAMPLLIYSKHMTKADREALCTFCMQHLEETDAELNWLARVILHSEEWMKSLEAVTKSRDALQDGWATLVQDQWLNNLANIDLIQLSESLGPMESGLNVDREALLLSRHQSSVTGYLDMPVIILGKGDTIALWYLPGGLAWPMQNSPQPGISWVMLHERMIQPSHLPLPPMPPTIQHLFIVTHIPAQTDCVLDIPTLGLQFDYHPSTVVAFSGRLLQHGVNAVSGNRYSLAYYMRDNFRMANSPHPCYTWQINTLAHLLPTAPPGSIKFWPPDWPRYHWMWVPMLAQHHKMLGSGLGHVLWSGACQAGCTPWDVRILAL
ncbi:hypothetical protein V8B97DRAFT_1919406 [Scleroderma yunnanense]